jgi:hypothetical protein
MDTTWNQIETLAAKAGAKYPSLVAAQWALESGWGKHVSGKNNFFGVKGKGTVVTTTEFINGKQVTVRDEFKDYASVEECVRDLVDKWYKDYKGYKGVNNAPTISDAARELVKQSYATDPRYAEKLIELLRTQNKLTAPAKAPKMIGPKKRPQDFGFKVGDHHLVVNDVTETVKAFNFDGKLLWELPCLARGQGSDHEYKLTNTDTPPGLYKLGTVYRDYDKVGAKPAYDRTLMSYGWYSFDMIELENQEAKFGRAGIMVHGGGSACGWPGAWASMQKLFATHGCVRMHNQHLRDHLLPLTKAGTVYVSVYQEG